MAAMAPGVSAALITTVAGLLVAIPSMFGYNWLVHNLRVFTVNLDNFAQELVSQDGNGIFVGGVNFCRHAQVFTTQLPRDIEWKINITPLLDLAFVLLIIFVITTPLLEQSINLKLPKGMGQPDKKIDQRNVRTVEVSTTGVYVLDKQRMSLGQLTARLAGESRSNPNLIVYIRADQMGLTKRRGVD